jgi:general L-amino acid transport system substrate-binding protein
MRKLIALLCMGVLVLGWQTAAAQPETPAVIGPTLNSILSRGVVNCGVSADFPGFGVVDPNSGLLNGFDVDFCRALAAALFGDATAVETIPLFSPTEGRAALQDGQIDVLLQMAVVSLADDASDMEFAPVIFYSGQSFLTRADSPVQDWPGLSSANICVVAGGSAEESLPAALDLRGLSAIISPLNNLSAAWDGLSNGRCDAISADLTSLTLLQQQADDSTAYGVWQRADQIYTREPFAPLLRAGDDQWANIVRWTILGLIQAEQLGISSETVTTLKRGKVPNPQDATQPFDEVDADYLNRVGWSVARVLDTSLGMGAQLGLANGFMQSVVEQVGNYGEIYARNLGSQSPLPIARTLNALATTGGLIYAPDWR